MLTNADNLAKRMTAAQLTDLKNCSSDHITDLPCYPILVGLCYYQHPGKTRTYITRIIEELYQQLRREEYHAP